MTVPQAFCLGMAAMALIGFGAAIIAACWVRDLPADFFWPEDQDHG